jgi:heat shock protein HslJ
MKPFTMLFMLVGIPVMLACAGTQSGETETKTDAMQITPRQLKDIAGIEWHLKIMKIDNESIPLIEDTKNTFSCDENGKVAGVASINRYFGNFSLKEDGEIIWSKAFGMTRMAGPPELMEQEAKFMQALPQTSRIYLKKEMLVLISTDNSTVLEFQEN